MTYSPTSNQGSGSAAGSGFNYAPEVTATVATTIAADGAPLFPNSPNYGSGLSSTAKILQTLNTLNAGTTPSRPTD